MGFFYTLVVGGRYIQVLIWVCIVWWVVGAGSVIYSDSYLSTVFILPMTLDLRVGNEYLELRTRGVYFVVWHLPNLFIKWPVHIFVNLISSLSTLFTSFTLFSSVDLFHISQLHPSTPTLPYTLHLSPPLLFTLSFLSILHTFFAYFCTLLNHTPLRLSFAFLFHRFSVSVKLPRFRSFAHHIRYASTRSSIVYTFVHTFVYFPQSIDSLIHQDSTGMSMLFSIPIFYFLPFVFLLDLSTSCPRRYVNKSIPASAVTGCKAIARQLPAG